MNESNSSPAATYFDGYLLRRRTVTLEFSAALDIYEDGAFVAAWAYGDVRRLRAPGGAMRLRAISSHKDSWLEITDPAQQREVETHCKLLGGESPPDARPQRRRFMYAGLATLAFVGFLWAGVPRMAGGIAPFIPVEWERTLGDLSDAQVRSMFSGRQCEDAKGGAALKKLSQKLQDAGRLRLPATMAVIQSKTPNAFALPGGKVYVLSGLLDKANSQDEVIGVLAHELGHLEHRDHLKRVIASGGTAVLLGMMVGDVGGGMISQIGSSLLSAAHSREAESQADDFAAKTLEKLGRPAKPMGELLVRITGSDKNGGLMSILQDHPLSDDRLAKLAKADKGAKQPPLLTDEEWKALKAVCE